MRILGIHADHVSYKVTKKTKIAEPDPIKEDRMEDCVLLFASVEKSDEISPELTVSATVDSILVRLGRLGAKRVMLFPYAHLASDLGCPGISQWILKNIQSRLNEKGIETKRAAFGWYKEFEIKSKGHPMADFR
jgi:threonyl-tRNA synthetase